MESTNNEPKYNIPITVNISANGFEVSTSNTVPNLPKADSSTSKETKINQCEKRKDSIGLHEHVTVNPSTSNEKEASTSNPAPNQPKAGSSKTKKETKPNQCAKCAKDAIFKTKSWLCKNCLTEISDKCETCQYEGTVEKLKKHMAYFCGKCEICGPGKVDENFEQTHQDIVHKNNKIFPIKVTRKYEWCVVKGDFGTAICRYTCYNDSFIFEVYTDIPCFELYKYKIVIRLSRSGVSKSKTLETEFASEYDWKLTMGNWKKEGFAKDFKINVNIHLK